MQFNVVRSTLQRIFISLFHTRSITFYSFFFFLKNIFPFILWVSVSVDIAAFMCRAASVSFPKRDYFPPIAVNVTRSSMFESPSEII